MLIVFILALDQQTASENLCLGQPSLFLNPEQKALPSSPPTCFFNLPQYSFYFNLKLDVNSSISNKEQLYGKPVLRKLSRSTTNVYRQCDVSIEKKIDQSGSVKFFEDRQT